MSEHETFVATTEQPAVANALHVEASNNPLVVRFRNGLQVYIVNDKLSVVSFDPVDNVKVLVPERRVSTWLFVVAAVAAVSFSCGFLLREIKN